MANITVIGQYYPEGGSRFISSQVLLGEDGHLRLLDENGQALCNISRDEIAVKQKLGSVPREIHLPELGLLSIPSEPAIDTWLATSDNRLHAVESSRRAVALSLLLVPLCLYGFFTYLVPATAIVFAEFIPRPAVEIASHHTMLALDKSLLEPSQIAQEQQDAFRLQWQTTIEQLDLKPEHYSINFRFAEKMGANAFALPDGTIVITDQLVTLLENDSAVLEAILLHEIGHVEHKHSMRLISEVLATSLAVNYFFGDLGAMVELFAGMSSTLMQNQFSQKLEWQADDFALQQLDRLDLPRENFTKAMEKLAELMPKEGELEVFLQSHPSMAQRIKNAREGHE